MEHSEVGGRRVILIIQVAQVECVERPKKDLEKTNKNKNNQEKKHKRIRREWYLKASEAGVLQIGIDDQNEDS